ncbi:MAG: hypothetical protein HRT35_30755 [Algicola sp.]|nr:hypothetical protein [Algicola sp.]
MFTINGLWFLWWMNGWDWSAGELWRTESELGAGAFGGRYERLSKDMRVP